MAYENWCETSRIGRMMDNKLTTIILQSLVAAFTSQAAYAQMVDTAEDAARYEFHGDRVYDKQTDLSWMRCSVGQQWRAPDRCIGKPKVFTFYEAQRLPKKDLAWRVPSPFEFSTLFRGQLKTFSTLNDAPIPKINTQAFPDMDPSRLLYWTNETTSSTNAWYADFEYGSLKFVYGDYGFLHQKFPVRLMHTGNFGDGG